MLSELAAFWSTWGGLSWIVAAVVLAGAAYARGVSRLWRRAGVGRGVGVAKTLAFYLGLAALLAALASPLDALAHVLFTAHMAQHMLLILIAAPLLAYGAPVLAWLWALPPAGRRSAARRWNRAGWLRRAWRVLTHPVVTWSCFALALWVWHLPGMYQLAVIDPLVHAAEHGSLLAAAYLFWWPVLRPMGRRRLGHGLAIVYVFAASLQVTMLGAVLSLAPDPLYPIYAGGAATWNLTALDDQRLAAIVMRTPMALGFLGMVAALFLRWMTALEARAAPERGVEA